MNPPCVMIKASQSKLGKNQIYMSQGLCQQLSCDTHITITFGRMHQEVSIIPFTSSDYSIMCCKTLLQEWGLFEDETVLRFSSPSKDEVLIGPVICVVTEIKPSLDLFGSITTFCEEFASLSDLENCFFYVSTLDDLLNGTKKAIRFNIILGYYKMYLYQMSFITESIIEKRSIRLNFKSLLQKRLKMKFPFLTLTT